MEEDILKTWARDDSSTDMMAMMMQTEKFPELCQPFYNNTLTYAENELSCGSCSSTTTLLPVFSSVNPNVIPLTPTPAWINPPLFNNPLQQPMTPSLQLQPNNEVVPSGRLRINPIPYPSTEKKSSVAAMREMIFRIAVMQPIHIEPESVKPPKRRNVKISKDPQSVAARHRRERISERIRILQRLVPGGTKMDTASMLDEAIHYVKFLKKQVQTLEHAAGATRPLNAVVGFPGGVISNASVNHSALVRGCQPCQMLASPSKQMLS